MKKRPVMNVAVTVNDNYVYPLKIMLHSLYEQNRDVKVKVYMIYSDVSLKNRKELEKLCQSYQGAFQPIKIDGDYFENAPRMLHFSKEMYYRILAAQFLPEQVNRILYMDPDIIVTGSLRRFYRMDMKNAFFAGARDRLQDGLRKKADPSRPYTYINSGVLLCNLKLLRKEQKVEEVFDYIKENAQRLEFPDQDLINELYRDRIVYVSDCYNFNPNILYWEEYFLYNFFPFAVKKGPAIIHYMGSDKPWNPNYWKGLYHYYWKVEIRHTDRNKVRIGLRILRNPICQIREGWCFFVFAKRHLVNFIRKRMG